MSTHANKIIHIYHIMNIQMPIRYILLRQLMNTYIDIQKLNIDAQICLPSFWKGGKDIITLSMDF